MADARALRCFACRMRSAAVARRAEMGFSGGRACPSPVPRLSHKVSRCASYLIPSERPPAISWETATACPLGEQRHCRKRHILGRVVLLAKLPASRKIGRAKEEEPRPPRATYIPDTKSGPCVSFLHLSSEPDREMNTDPSHTTNQRTCSTTATVCLVVQSAELSVSCCSTLAVGKRYSIIFLLASS